MRWPNDRPPAAHAGCAPACCAARRASLASGAPAPLHWTFQRHDGTTLAEPTADLPAAPVAPNRISGRREHPAAAIVQRLTNTRRPG